MKRTSMPELAGKLELLAALLDAELPHLGNGNDLANGLRCARTDIRLAIGRIRYKLEIEMCWTHFGLKPSHMENYG